jgi:hypothetical protein
MIALYRVMGLGEAVFCATQFFSYFPVIVVRFWNQNKIFDWQPAVFLVWFESRNEFIFYISKELISNIL